MPSWPSDRSRPVDAVHLEKAYPNRNLAFWKKVISWDLRGDMTGEMLQLRFDFVGDCLELNGVETSLFRLFGREKSLLR